MRAYGKIEVVQRLLHAEVIAVKGPQSVWLVIHMIRGEDGAQRIVDMLTQEGLVAKMHPVYRNRSAQDNFYEIVVLKSESNEARSLLVEKGLLT